MQSPEVRTFYRARGLKAELLFHQGLNVRDDLLHRVLVHRAQDFLAGKTGDLILWHVIFDFQRELGFVAVC